MLFNNNQKLGVFYLVGFSILFILLMKVHLMPGLIAGLLTYTLTIKLDDFLAKHMHQLGRRSKLLSVTLLLTIIIAIIIGGCWALFTWFVGMAKHPTETIAAVNVIVDNVSSGLPDVIKSYIPDDFSGLQEHLTLYLKEHAFYLQSVVAHAFHILVILIVGMIIGLIFGFKHQRRSSLDKRETRTPLVKAFNACMERLVTVFQYVAISQCAIALFNAIMTAIFLFIILPVFGIHLPFSKSLVAATFLFGLIPIVGNLIVNVLMFFIAFTVSLGVSIVVILYLILIHKVEYILNAKIVGSKIHAGICELLIAMLFCETLFGIIGLVFAPIFYAFIKLSLKNLKLI